MIQWRGHPMVQMLKPAWADDVLECGVWPGREQWLLIEGVTEPFTVAAEAGVLVETVPGDARAGPGSVLLRVLVESVTALSLIATLRNGDGTTRLRPVNRDLHPPEIKPYFQNEPPPRPQPQVTRTPVERVKPVWFNGKECHTARYLITGYDLRLPDDLPAEHAGLLSGAVEDAEELVIVARRNTITEPIRVPGCDLYMHGMRLRFALRQESPDPVFSTSPKPFTAPAPDGQDGEPGQAGGAIYLTIRQRIMLPRGRPLADVSGGAGQAGGREGDPLPAPFLEVFGSGRSSWSCGYGPTGSGKEPMATVKRWFPVWGGLDVTDTPFEQEWYIEDRPAALAILNRAVRVVIRVHPVTYLWDFRRKGLRVADGALETWTGRVIPGNATDVAAVPDASTWNDRQARLYEALGHLGARTPPGAGGVGGFPGHLFNTHHLFLDPDAGVRQESGPAGADGPRSDLPMPTPLAITSSTPDLNQARANRNATLPNPCDAHIVMSLEPPIHFRVEVVMEYDGFFGKDSPRREVGPKNEQSSTPIERRYREDGYTWVQPAHFAFIADWMGELHDFATPASWRQAQRLHRLLEQWAVDPDLSSADNDWLQASLQRARQTAGAIAAEHDAEGRPVGWAPMLSLEACFRLLDTSVGEDLDLLVQAQSLRRAMQKKQNVALLCRQQVEAQQTARESAAKRLKTINQKIGEAQQDVASKQVSRDTAVPTAQQALAKATAETLDEEHRRMIIAGVLSGVGAVCSLVPWGQPVLGAVGSTISSAATWDFQKSPDENLLAAANAGGAASLGNALGGIAALAKANDGALEKRLGERRAGERHPLADRVEAANAEFAALQKQQEELDKMQGEEQALWEHYSPYVNRGDFDRLKRLGPPALKAQARANGFGLAIDDLSRVENSKAEYAAKRDTYSKQIATVSASRDGLTARMAKDRETAKKAEEQRLQQRQAFWQSAADIGTALPKKAVEVAQSVRAARYPPDRFRQEVDALMRMTPSASKAVSELAERSESLARAIARLTGLVQSASDCTAQIALANAAIDSLNAQQFAMFSHDDGELLAIFGSLERQAAARLRNRQRLLHRAFEYRYLRAPDSGQGRDLLPARLQAKLTEEADNCVAGKTLNDQALRTVFRGLLQEIVDELTSENQKLETGAVYTYELSGAELTALKAGQGVQLNLMRAGVIPLDAIHPTIVAIEIDDTMSPIKATAKRPCDLSVKFVTSDRAPAWGMPNGRPTQRLFRNDKPGNDKPGEGAAAGIYWSTVLNFKRTDDGYRPWLARKEAYDSDGLRIITDKLGLEAGRLLAPPSAMGDIIITAESNQDAEVSIEAMQICVHVRHGRLLDRPGGESIRTVQIGVEGDGETIIGVAPADLDGLCHVVGHGLRLYDASDTPELFLTAPPTLQGAKFAGWRIHKSMSTHLEPGDPSQKLPALRVALDRNVRITAVYGA